MPQTHPERLAPLARLAETDEPSLMLSELYVSLQGESSRAGLPCVLVRLSVCNLRCRWCDSSYTFHQGEPRPVAGVLAEALALAPQLVLVTGGEPLLQPPVHHLIAGLLEAGREVMVETSGAVDISTLDSRVIRIVDLKCPGSGELDSNLWSNLELLGERDELKLVLADRADYEWARDQIRGRGLARRCTVLLSPVHGELEPRELAAWMLEDALPARLNLQLHKYVWPQARRGV